MIIRMPAHRPVPGEPPSPRLHEVQVRALRDGELLLPEAVISDKRGGPEDVFALSTARPAGGGGPLASVGDRNAARMYGITNTAYHVQRGLRRLAALLGRPLPTLEVHIGMHSPAHDTARGAWGGGHYRLPARSYSDHEESGVIAPTGEVHLGAGARHVLMRDGSQYFAAPAHNAAIIYHELGHHLCRHTADFRGNTSREPHLQTNRRTAIEEGTCDYLAAVLLGTADIYGWHRGHLSAGDPERRRLDVGATMARFRGGHRHDPHLDGTIWASALWSAREGVCEAGMPGSDFDRLLIGALDLLGEEQPGHRDPVEQLRRARHFSRALAAMLEVDSATGGRLGSTVERAFARHGIRVGESNSALRRTTRANRAAVAV